MKIRSYPFKCPKCHSAACMEMAESDYDDGEYREDWQCDACGAEWVCEFEFTGAHLTNVDED